MQNEPNSFILNNEIIKLNHFSDKNYPFDMGEMYDLVNMKKEEGVKGYQIVHKYFDAKKLKSDREWSELEQSVIMKKQNFPKIIKTDKDGNIIKPNKLSYIDKIYSDAKKNQVNSEKFPELFEKWYPSYSKKSSKQMYLESKIALEGKGSKNKLYSYKRKTYADDIMDNLEKEKKVNEEKQEKINEIIEKHNLNKIQKIDYWENIKEKSKGSLE